MYFEFSPHRIVRTRDPVKLEPCDIVVDVGGVYDPNTQRYDHHQRQVVSLNLVVELQHST